LPPTPYHASSSTLPVRDPPLGTLFVTADPDAGPTAGGCSHQDAKGDVWVAYTDFEWIRKRHGIGSRDKEFKMASEVIGSITSTVKAN
jgi:hypothetical protein